MSKPQLTLIELFNKNGVSVTERGSSSPQQYLGSKNWQFKEIQENQEIQDISVS